jgi:hypothetical protein
MYLEKISWDLENGRWAWDAENNIRMNFGHG